MNQAIIAPAGSGKTTAIVNQSLKKHRNKILIITYTLNNLNEIKNKFYLINGFIPKNIEIQTWFTFLLNDIVRPYQGIFYESRINNIAFIQGQSTRLIKKTNSSYYLNENSDIYSDKMCEFGLLCNTKTDGKIIDRLEKLYDEIYIDEVQDLAGYDLDLLELLLKSKIFITLVGDHRQATFQTNNSKKNKKYSRSKIINIFIEWENKKLINIEYNQKSFRCNQLICDFANKIFKNYPPAIAEHNIKTQHDGIFLINSSQISKYIKKFNPQILRYSKITSCNEYDAINFGDSKGLTFDRVLIFPNNPIIELLKTGDFSHISKLSEKFYVAVTRAKFSVTFVFDGDCQFIDRYTV